MKLQSLIAPALCLGLFSCVSYSEKALENKQLLQALEKNQQSFVKGESKSLTFDQAAAIMSAENPQIAALKARYEQLEEKAQISTPLDNPSAGLGYSFGRRLDLAEASQNQPFVSFGFSIPLNGRLSLQDDLNQMLAARAKLEVALKHRQLALDLHNAYVKAGIARATILIEKKKSRRLAQMESETSRGQEAGLYSAIDIGRIKSERIIQEQISLERQKEALQNRFALAAIINKQLPSLTAISLDVLPPLPIIDVEDLKEKLKNENPQLLRLEADYRLAEKRLQLEIRKQYPDLDIDLGWEREPGEKRQTFSLGVGIQLPIFDRNQQAIATADKARDIVRADYEKAAASLLLQLDKNIALFELNKKALALYEKDLLPSLENNERLARRAVEAGAVDLQRYWDFQKELLNARSQKSLYLTELYNSILAIEKLINSRLADSARTSKE